MSDVDETDPYDVWRPKYDALASRLAKAERLLRETEGHPMPWDWLDRRDAFLADQPTANRETADE